MSIAEVDLMDPACWRFKRSVPELMFNESMVLTIFAASNGDMNG